MRRFVYARGLAATAVTLDLIVFSRGGELLAGGPRVDGSRALLSGNDGLSGVC